MDVCLQLVEVRVGEEVNKGLDLEFSTIELEEALNQMTPLKSSGLDGFGTGFYKKTLGNCKGGGM